MDPRTSTSKYAIRCWSDLYGGLWQVVRVEDRRIIHSGSLYECLRWVKTWGDQDFMSTRKGTELSHRAVL